jgi:hypothetical protein
MCSSFILEAKHLCNFSFFGILRYFTQTGGITSCSVFADAFPGHKMQVHLLRAPGILIIWVVTNGRVSEKPRRLPRHQRAQAHNSTHTVSTLVLCTGYVVNKTVSCVLMNMILVAVI